VSVYVDDGDVRLYQGDALTVLRELPDESVHTCVTSPPYFGLRDYGTGRWDGGDPACEHSAGRGINVPQTKHPNGGGYPASAPHRGGGGRSCVRCGAVRIDDQIGLEASLDEYLERLVGVFRELRRVLRPDGTLWLNVGDSYASSGVAGPLGKPALGGGGEFIRLNGVNEKLAGYALGRAPTAPGTKPKDLIGIPWRLALALQADGWWLRSDIIWAKPNPMPESVTDRPTSAHEHVFLLTPSARYFYDADAVREPAIHAGVTVGYGPEAKNRSAGDGVNDRRTLISRNVTVGSHRNLRNVWRIATEPTPSAHFATFPQALVERCLKAGTSERGVCADCGAPWRRVVERGAAEFTPTGYAPPGSNGRTLARGTAFVGASAQTTGWEPACACDAAAVPATVLDPFVGSGTTALVARRLGLRAVGIDLSASYLAIAARRLQQLSLFAVEGVPAQEGRA
jgi:DNA modification methylase